jgi:ribosomal protein L11 methyltransferase
MSSHGHTRWWEISIDIDPIAHESLSAFLFDLGCSGIVSEDFRDHSLKAYIPFHENTEDIRGRVDTFLYHLGQIFPEIQSPKIRISKIKEQDWTRNWRRFFHADRVTSKLLIIPAWEPVPSALDAHIIRIDPGPAFGTGQHPTTRMCIAAMEQMQLTESWTMLDVGTGSGILAIYGAKLGAKKVVAIDIDPDALQWAKRNIRLNDLEGFIELSSQPLSVLKGSFSLLTANLTLQEIIHLESHFHGHLNPGGWLILSGVLREQVNQIRACFTNKDFQEDQTLFQEEWACMVAKKSEKA